MTWLIIGLIMFHGLHSFRMIAPQWRSARIASMGEGPWKGAYSIASVIAFVVLVWGYYQASQDFDYLYTPPAWGRHLAYLLMALSFVSLMVFNLKPGILKPALDHPFLLAVILWSIAHLLVNGTLASTLLFGSFLIWAILNRISVARRDAPLPARGPVSNDIMAVVSGLVLWFLFIWKLHYWLFGVAPLG